MPRSAFKKQLNSRAKTLEFFDYVSPHRPLTPPPPPETPATTCTAMGNKSSKAKSFKAKSSASEQERMASFDAAEKEFRSNLAAIRDVLAEELKIQGDIKTLDQPSTITRADKTLLIEFASGQLSFAADGGACFVLESVAKGCRIPIITTGTSNAGRFQTLRIDIEDDKGRFSNNSFEIVLGETIPRSVKAAPATARTTTGQPALVTDSGYTETVDVHNMATKKALTMQEAFEQVGQPQAGTQLLRIYTPADLEERYKIISTMSTVSTDVPNEMTEILTRRATFKEAKAPEPTDGLSAVIKMTRKTGKTLFKGKKAWGGLEERKEEGGGGPGGAARRPF